MQVTKGASECRHPTVESGWIRGCGRGIAVLLLLGFLFSASAARAQNRGVYPLGLSAINSGVAPASGFSYSNAFLFYTRDESKGADGEVIGTGQQSVVLDMNTLLWASDSKIASLGGAKFSSAVTIPIANNSLSTELQGAVNSGGGLGDAYLQPAILSWGTKRVDVRGVLGLLVPTGKFNAGANDNVGSGYWTPAIASGQTVYVTEDRATSISLFEIYEFHTTQSGTNVHPGQSFDLDYSVMHTFPVSAESRLQAGLVGYGEWQTSAKTGPNIPPEEEARRYRVNGLGLGMNLVLPARKVSLSFKYFDEFGNQWTYQGYSVQITVGIGF
jgi:hypothetical protein